MAIPNTKYFYVKVKIKPFKIVKYKIQNNQVSDAAGRSYHCLSFLKERERERQDSLSHLLKSLCGFLPMEEGESGV